MQEIASAIASGRCVLFAGSGTSRDAGLPDWLGLVERLRDDLRDQGKLQPAYYDAITAVLADHKDLGVSLQILQSAVRRQELVLALRRILNPTSPSQITKALADIGFAGTVTTNYDRVINETVSGNAYTLSNGSHDLKIVPTAVSASDQFLFKVHGDIDDQLSPTDSLVTRGGPFMVITEADFSILQGSRGDQLLLSLHSILQERSVLFLGYSFGDPDIGHILRYLGDNCQFIHPSWFVSRKGSSVPNLPSNVTPVLELDDWSQLPDWLAELKEAVEQEQRNPTETVVGVVTSRKLISDEEHQTLLALARYLNGLESDDLAERVLAAALLEEISAKESFDTSWLQVKVGELLDIGPAWAEALSHATAALLMRIGAMEQIDGGVFRPIKKETEYRMKNAQREWERDRNRFYSRVRTRMSAEPSPEFEKFATNLDKLLQDLCIEFGQTLAESMYRGSGKKLAWEQVKQYVDIHFSKSADIKAVRTLLDYVFANPSDAEYPYLYRLLSAAFLANSVRLDPTVSTS
ncbi:MAG: SIR2 family protein, partial [Dehalococcoidia bacterium]